MTREHEQCMQSVTKVMSVQDHEHVLDMLDEQLQQAATKCRQQEDHLTDKRAKIKSLKAEIEQLQNSKELVLKEAKENSAAAKK